MDSPKHSGAETEGKVRAALFIAALEEEARRARARREAARKEFSWLGILGGMLYVALIYLATMAVSALYNGYFTMLVWNWYAPEFGLPTLTLGGGVVIQAFVALLIAGWRPLKYGATHRNMARFVVDTISYDFYVVIAATATAYAAKLLLF